MRGSYAVQSRVAHYFRKKFITQRSRCNLQTQTSLFSPESCVSTPAKKLQSMPLRKSVYKFLIRIGVVTAQPMIEMENRENDAQLRTQLKQQTQHRNRIGSPGNR
jgi:hypothetical protein